MSDDLQDDVPDDWPRAFALASTARTAAAELVAAVRSGEVDLDEAHRRADEDPLVARVFAVKVYEACPGIGKVRARRTMASLGLDDDVTLGSVAPGPRAEIVRRFAGPACEGQG